MALLPILSLPDPRLRQVAQPVEQVNDALRRVMDDMLETMKLDDQGVGLAGNQVGVLQRIIVIDIGEEYNKEPLFIVNPEIVTIAKSTIRIMDGCLSVPDQYAETDRAEHVKIRYQDRYGASKELYATGLLSACIQHEIDHINGVLFIDHLTALKRKLILSRLGKKPKKKS